MLLIILIFLAFGFGLFIYDARERAAVIGRTDAANLSRLERTVQL